MWVISVEPMPSRICTPKRSWNGWKVSAGRGSAAETPQRTDANVSAARSEAGQRGVEGRDAEQQRRAQRRRTIPPTQRRGRRPGGLDDRRGADRERERQRVPQPVGVEHRPDGVAAVVGADAEHLRGVGVGREPQVEMAVHGQLGPARRARTCTARSPATPPRSRRVAAPSDRRAGPADERVPLGRAGHDHGLDLGRRGTDRVDLAGPLGRDDQHAGAAVGDDGAQVAAGQQRVHRRRRRRRCASRRGRRRRTRSESSITMATRCSGSTPSAPERRPRWPAPRRAARRR